MTTLTVCHKGPPSFSRYLRRLSRATQKETGARIIDPPGRWEADRNALLLLEGLDFDRFAV
ncbi:MAG: hypothetical protein ACE5FH_04420 [Candidatus Zixiibacteriota bacterium]